MLVLQRKLYQSIQIGPNITVTVVQIGGDNVKLGIEAPRGVEILRDDAKDKQPRPRGSAERKAHEA